ncbi:MAG: exonuclease domain-containing protein [Oscillospiraceae bacterium]|nr:exonuclease domain-containing protein [Oscillospiraceae bacterium]
MIVMDLEWNRSYDKKRLDEILQIGAVRVAEAGGRILSTFDAFVKPRVHKRFDPGARKLPDLQRSIDCETTFAEAWAAFTDWCGDERVFAFWGPDDFGVIRQNCAYWGVPAFEPERVYDFQRAFAHAYGEHAPVMALWRVVDYLGIPEVFEFHNALYDAMYTALVGAWLRQEDLDYAPPKRVKRPPPRRRQKRARPREERQA